MLIKTSSLIINILTVYIISNLLVMYIYYYYSLISKS